MNLYLKLLNSFYFISLLQQHYNSRQSKNLNLIFLSVHVPDSVNKISLNEIVEYVVPEHKVCYYISRKFTLLKSILVVVGFFFLVFCVFNLHNFGKRRIDIVDKKTVIIVCQLNGLTVDLLEMVIYSNGCINNIINKSFIYK